MIYCYLDAVMLRNNVNELIRFALFLSSTCLVARACGENSRRLLRNTTYIANTCPRWDEQTVNITNKRLISALFVSYVRPNTKTLNRYRAHDITLNLPLSRPPPASRWTTQFHHRKWHQIRPIKFPFTPNTFPFDWHTGKVEYITPGLSSTASFPFFPRTRKAPAPCSHKRPDAHTAATVARSVSQDKHGRRSWR